MTQFVRRAAFAAALMSSSAALADTLTAIAGYSAPNTSTSVLGINDGGWMTGTVSYLDAAGVPTGAGDGFLRAPDGTYTLFSNGQPFTQGRAIRNDNTIVGYSDITAGTGLTSREFVRSPSGVLTALTNPTTGEELHGIAQGINASGTIVGNFRYLVGGGPQQRNHGFLLNGTSFTELEHPGLPNNSFNARGIDTAGTVVGWSGGPAGTQAWIRSLSGTYTFYDHPSATLGTFFQAITDTGTILGSYQGASGSRAFYYSIAAGTFTDIVIPGATNVQSFGANNVGQYVLNSDVGSFIYEVGGPAAPDGSPVYMPVDDGSPPDRQHDFSFGVVPGVTYYIDPAAALGFEYQSGTGPLFTSVTLPVGFAPDDIFSLQFWNGSAWVNGGTATGGVTYTFAGPIDRFRVRGIPASAGLDANDPQGFITGLTFDGPGTFNGYQLSLVPEPSQWALLIGGFGLAGWAARRRRSNLVTA